MTKQTITPTQIVQGLGDYLTSIHEFEAVGSTEHTSFYVDLYRQWQKVPPFTDNPTQSMSADLWQQYWQRMSDWYLAFRSQEGQITDPQMAYESEEMAADLYTIEGVQAIVLNRLSFVAKVEGNVVSVDQPIRLLKEQLEYMAMIDLDMQSVADVNMINEYWHLMKQLIEDYRS